MPGEFGCQAGLHLLEHGVAGGVLHVAEGELCAGEELAAAVEGGDGVLEGRHGALVDDCLDLAVLVGHALTDGILVVGRGNLVEWKADGHCRIRRVIEVAHERIFASLGVVGGYCHD